MKIIKTLPILFLCIPFLNSYAYETRHAEYQIINNSSTGVYIFAAGYSGLDVPSNMNYLAPPVSGPASAGSGGLASGSSTPMMSITSDADASASGYCAFSSGSGSNATGCLTLQLTPVGVGLSNANSSNSYLWTIYRKVWVQPPSNLRSHKWVSDTVWGNTNSNLISVSVSSSGVVHKSYTLTISDNPAY